MAWLGWLASPLAQLLSKLINLPLWRGRLGLGLGLSFFKFFPANLFGGIPALKTYQLIFPNVSFCPTGGIDEESYLEYLELENVLSVGGSWMMKQDPKL